MPLKIDRSSDFNALSKNCGANLKKITPACQALTKNFQSKYKLVREVYRKAAELWTDSPISSYDAEIRLEVLIEEMFF